MHTSAKDSDSFDFKNAKARGETQDDGHKEWIPVLSVDQGINRAFDASSLAMNFEEIKVTYRDYDGADVSEPVDTWLEPG